MCLRQDEWNLRLKGLRDAPAPRFRKSAPTNPTNTSAMQRLPYKTLLVVEYASHHFPTLGDVCHVRLALVSNLPETPGCRCSDLGRKCTMVPLQCSDSILRPRTTITSNIHRNTVQY
jgi:hypothetical protein